MTLKYVLVYIQFALNFNLLKYIISVITTILKSMCVLLFHKGTDFYVWLNPIWRPLYMFSAHIDVVSYLFHRLGICDCMLSSEEMNNNPSLQRSLVPVHSHNKAYSSWDQKLSCSFSCVAVYVSLFSGVCVCVHPVLLLPCWVVFLAACTGGLRTVSDPGLQSFPLSHMRRQTLPKCSISEVNSALNGLHKALCPSTK